MIDIGSTFENCFEILLRCILYEVRVGIFTSQSSDQIKKILFQCTFVADRNLENHLLQEELTCSSEWNNQFLVYGYCQHSPVPVIKAHDKQFLSPFTKIHLICQMAENIYVRMRILSSLSSKPKNNNKMETQLLISEWQLVTISSAASQSPK